MGNDKIRKVPYIVGKSKSLNTALARSHKIKNDPYQEKGQYITFSDMAPTPPHRHEEIGGPCDYRDKHTCAKDDGYGLQPPREGTEHKMVRSDHGIEQHLGPKSQYSQGIGIYRLVQGGREVIIDKPKGKGHKPHSYPLMHVISLDYRFSKTGLIGRPIGDNRQYDGPRSEEH